MKGGEKSKTLGGLTDTKFGLSDSLMKGDSIHVYVLCVVTKGKLERSLVPRNLRVQNSRKNTCF